MVFDRTFGAELYAQTMETIEQHTPVGTATATTCSWPHVNSVSGDHRQAEATFRNEVGKRRQRISEARTAAARSYEKPPQSISLGRRSSLLNVPSDGKSCLRKSRGGVPAEKACEP